MVRPVEVKSTNLYYIQYNVHIMYVWRMHIHLGDILKNLEEY